AALKGLGVDFVHGRGGVGHGAHLVGVKLLPPVHGGGDVHGHHDLTDELPVVGAGRAQALGQAKVVFTQNVVALLVVVAVAAGLAVQGIAGAPHGVFQSHHTDMVDGKDESNTSC